MPEQAWTQESVEKQAQELQQEQQPAAQPAEQQPESQGQPAEQPQSEEQPEAKVKEERVVPLAAVQEERAKRREETQKRIAIEQQNAQLVRQMQEMMAAVQNRTPQPQRDPNDVLGVMSDGIQRTQAELQQIRQQQDQERAFNAQRQQAHQFQTAVVSDEQQFAQQQPDYHSAAKFAREARAKEYQAMGLSRAQAEERLNVDVVQLCQWAFNNGESPAKTAYEWAKARGYVPAAKQLEMQQAGQRASMPSGGGGRDSGDPSLQALLKMDTTDFAKATSGDNWSKLIKKHMQ